MEEPSLLLFQVNLNWHLNMSETKPSEVDFPSNAKETVKTKSTTTKSDFDKQNAPQAKRYKNAHVFFMESW